ncbi:acid protease [Karstenula rhodostoma CBS 690.94]|uniref:Acid protease n=1 Tax=Karstenula rhodostoma CBS 690.94 TaxID=1392251 RepID=A0A9P4PMY3_9PLEO|nr:acid protease [Karstenula rhodostoma CBS 690.94]
MGDHTPSPTPSPSPIVYSPSQEFIGNDGQWSAFIIRVGSPAQNFRVIPSSKSSEIYVPIVDGCQTDNITSCGPLRGAYDFNGRESSGFLVNSSSTWHEIGLYEMDARPDLGFTANALYGLEILGLMLQNSGGPTLSNQVVAAVANPAVWVGMVGLGQKPANFSDFDNPQEGLIGTLRKEGKIPSRSYGYTAGAWYKRPQALASLTLGGYDQSRFDQNKVTFDFDPDDDKSLSLNVQSMVVQNTFNGSSNLLGVVNQPIYVTIDYTVPHLWLPRSVCDIFESEFHLTYDNSTDLYLVNDTVHTQLKAKNPSITIGFGKTAAPVGRVNIVLPYSAFDLQASHPIYPNATNYFPIRRALNESMYTFGRTLMQEAYLKVDYERSHFSIHQTLFPDTNAKQEIVPLLSPSDSVMEADQHSGVHISASAIAGIVIGDLALLLLLVLSCITRASG